MSLKISVAVYFANTFSLQSSCTIDVTYFPFDQQTCIMKFGSWTFTGDQVSLSLFNNKNHVDLSDYWKSGTWDIIEVPAYLNVHNNTGQSAEISSADIWLHFRGNLSAK